MSEGAALAFVVEEFLRGDDVGCGMNEGIIPPRFEGGVMYALTARPGFVGVEACNEEVNDLRAVARGIEEGEGVRVEMEVSASESSVDDGVESDKLRSVKLGAANVKEASLSSSSNGTKSGAALCETGTGVSVSMLGSVR